jgi:hypothetical protein
VLSINISTSLLSTNTVVAHPKYQYFLAQIIQVFACDFNKSWQGGKSPSEHHQIRGKIVQKTYLGLHQTDEGAVGRSSGCGASPGSAVML